MFKFKIRKSTAYIMDIFMIGMEGYFQGRKISAKEAADRIGVNPKSLIAGYQRLLLAGIISSSSGQDNPGYIISRDPRDITLLEVMKALESFPRVDCTHKDGSDCVVCGAINKAMDSIESIYSSISLYDFYLSLKTEDNTFERNILLDKRDISSFHTS